MARSDRVGNAPARSRITWGRHGVGALPTLRRSPSASTLDECAAPVGEGTECLVGRDRGDQLEIIPLALGFRRLLGLVEVNRVNLSAVGADRAFAKERIASRHFLHFRYHVLPITPLLDTRHPLTVTPAPP